MSTLILGDGLLGSELERITGWAIQSRKKTGLDIGNIQTVHLQGFDCVVNCIANTDTYNNSGGHRDVNYQFLVDLSGACAASNIKLIHISTDYVYANSDCRNEECSLAPALNLYSYTKAMADLHLINFWKEGLDWCIIRTSHKPKPFPWAKAWDDVWTSADYVDVIANLILKLINHNVSGIWNVGTEPKTMFELAKKTNPNVQPEHCPHQHVPQNTVMSLIKLQTFLDGFN